MPDVQVNAIDTVAALFGMKSLFTVIVFRTPHGVGTVMVVLAVVTVEPNARARPINVDESPSVILSPAAVPRKMFPMKFALAPTVVPPTGAQYTLSAQAPLARTTFEFAAGSSAPPGLKI